MEPPSPTHRRRLTPRVALVVAVVVVVVVGLSAVGLFAVVGGGKSDRLTADANSKRSPAAVLTGAAGASRAAGTARIRTSVRRFDSGSAAKEIVEGVIDFGSPAFDLTFGFDGAGYSPFRGLPDITNERAFSDGTTVWTTIPPYMDVLPQMGAGTKAKDPFKGKKYLATPVGESADAPKVGFEELAGHPLGFSIGSAPADVLSYLTGVGTAVEEAKEPIDGEEAVRYGAQIDLDALQRALPSDQRSFDAYDFKPDVPHTFPAKVWIDRDGRLRKLTYRLDLSMLLTDVALKADYVVEECAEPDAALITKAQAGDRKAMASLASFDGKCTERPSRPEELIIEGSVEMSSYGAPLQVSPPPAAEVVLSDELNAFFEAQAHAAISAAPSGRRSRLRRRG